MGEAAERHRHPEHIEIVFGEIQLQCDAIIFLDSADLQIVLGGKILTETRPDCDKRVETSGTYRNV